MDITASKLYDYIKCPHKIWRDIYGPQEEKIQETNPFVELLWQKGLQHEKRIVKQLGDFVDVTAGTFDERYQKTIVRGPWGQACLLTFGPLFRISITFSASILCSVLSFRYRVIIAGSFLV